MFPIYFVVFIILQQGKAQDECNQYKSLPNAGLRYFNYRVNEVIVEDSSLIPGWYRANDEIMPTVDPNTLDICGTQFPIWMNGIHPTIEEGVVNRVACAVGVDSSCSTSYGIKVRNCTTYSVYYLVNTRTRNEAYCFGIGEDVCFSGHRNDAMVTALGPIIHHGRKTISKGGGQIRCRIVYDGEVPTFVPLKPVVYPIEVIRKHQTRNTTSSRVHFVCNFEPSTDASDDGLNYQVFWYTVKNNVETMYIMPEKPKGNLSDLQLTEDIFMEKMKQTLGVEISCVVLVLSGPKGIPGSKSERSNAFFAGIIVDVKKSNIVRGNASEQGLVTVTSTIPIGCPTPSNCSLPITASVPDESKCDGPSFGNGCGTLIKSDKWNNSHNIVIQATDSTQYSLHGIFTVYLKTGLFWTSARIWDNYSLPDFQVEIFEPVKKDYPGKSCFSHNDPHMQTFDGRLYENHFVGEYILYRHLIFKAEVQIKTTSCNGRIQCNCGVAVRAGKDVYVVDMCENKYFFNYKDGLCLDSALDVRKNGNIYKVYFLYGTYVTVTVWPDSKLLNVDITSSVHDQGGNSTGLCGALMNNICTDDFRMRNGSLAEQGVNLSCDSNRWIEPETFINEWRVRPNERLFDLSEDVKSTLSPWDKYVCVCGKNSGNTDTTIRCGGHTTEECRTGTKVSWRTCKIITERRRRSAEAKDRFPTPKERKRRSTTNQLEENIQMTQEEALNYCRDYMSKSQIYDLCHNVPSVNSETNVETCALDIILTNTTVWSASARESMREQCLNEISRNNTFREVEEASGIVAEIQEKACPSLCSYRGPCVNGTCQCDPGYGSSDCSLNLQEPPDIFGLLDDGLCDERHIECNHAFVYGEIFAEGENLTCRIKSFILSIQGDRNYKETVYIPAEHETMFEVLCPVQKTKRKKRSFVTNIEAAGRFVIGYTISVSNDGQNYGKDFDLYMYNSECQLPENTSTTFSFILQDGYCFIDHTCVMRGTIYEQDECLICDDKLEIFDWSTRENHADCKNVPATSPSAVRTSAPSEVTTLIPKSSSRNLKINFAFLFTTALIFGIIFPNY